MDSIGKRKALIVEDNDSTIHLFSNYLDRMGISSDYVKDGRAAIKKAMDFDYNIVLMDIFMPDLDGFDATRKILDNKPNTPIIAISSAVNDLDRQRIVKLGAKEFLSKPIGFETFNKAVLKYIKD